MYLLYSAVVGPYVPYHKKEFAFVSPQAMMLDVVKATGCARCSTRSRTMAAPGGWREICAVLPSAKALPWLGSLNPAVKSSWSSGRQLDIRGWIWWGELIRGQRWGAGSRAVSPPVCYPVQKWLLTAGITKPGSRGDRFSGLV